jgi:transposase
MDAKGNDGAQEWRHVSHFMGLDWAKREHQVGVVDGEGGVLLSFRFKQSDEGWQKLRTRLCEATGSEDFSRIGVAIETNCGPVVERLLKMGFQVFPLNPKAAQRYRDRKAPSGVKNDELDAWSFADALRTDGHGWRPLRPEDSLTQQLRLLCRDEVALIEQRTSLANQLQQALCEYYPAALEAFDNWTTVPGAWAFIEAFPTPQALVKAGRRRWDAFLHKHHLCRPRTYAKRMEVFSRADAFRSPTAVARAKSMLALALVRQLQTLQNQLDLYRDAIGELFEQHPDRNLFGSLPAGGGILAPRLLSEFGNDRNRFDCFESVQCFAGTAPVTYQSGQMRKVVFRRACNKHFRAAIHLWANLSRSHCAWAEAYYQTKRRQGKSHACAVRCLGQRWLKIIWKMWRTRTPYNEALHLRNQVAHGSWVIELLDEGTAAKASSGKKKRALMYA